MIPLVIVIFHPLPDPFGQLGGCIVIVQKDQVLHRTMVTFDLPLGHGMIHLRPNMTDLMSLETFLQLMRDEAGPVVAEEPRPLDHLDMLDPGFCDGHIQRVFHVLGLHGPAELPGDDIAREVVHHRRQIIPTPMHDLQIRKIRLPELIRPGCRMFELVFGRDHGKHRRCDQAVGLEDPIDAAL